MIKELPSFFHQSIKYQIDRATLVKLHNIACNHLGLTNINHIRDKFEGQAYLDRFLIRSFAEIALQRVLDEQILSFEKKEKNKNYKPQFKIKEKSVQLIASDFDSYPLVPKAEFDFAAIVFANVISRETLLLGFVEREELLQNIDSQGVSPIQATTFSGSLKNFEIVKPLELISVD
jgi:hypothetical protein